MVTPGTEVRFPNHDTVRHHVYSFSQAKPFELKLYGRDETRVVTFDKAGIVDNDWIELFNTHTSETVSLAFRDAEGLVLSAAFATLAGMPPAYGLYSAMVPCVIAALFGSSRVMVTGPANAISLTVLAIMAPLAQPESPRYVELVITLAFMVGGEADALERAQPVL
mgnify:CR=1 FL=1